MARRFGTYALIMLIPVVVLGLILASSYRTEADQRGLAEGRSEATLMAETAIEPLLDGRPLAQGLSPSEQGSLNHLVKGAVANGTVQRLRLRDLNGLVVFSDDGSGFHQAPEDEAVEAAHGEDVVSFNRLNSDSVDTGRIGAEAVEVYMPLAAGSPAHRVGVLEVYLPYAPIQADVNAGVNTLSRNLAIGLALLFLILFVLSFSISRGLRRQLKVNAYQAEHDTLTDLPNRALFLRHARAALDRGRATGQPTTIAIIDLDRFREVNDALGHQNGDRLLTALSQRMAAHLRGVDALARLGGDEFGVILGNLEDPDQVLHRLRQVIEREITISGLPLTIESSIGYAVSPDHGTDVDELLQRADVAMYVAKRQHAEVVRYHPSQYHFDAANLSLVSELRQAIDSDQLVLHYQPKTSLDDLSVVGVEALVRWEHPTQGLLYPDRFIPLAEQTDLIDRLTGWVVTRALEDLGRMDASCPALSMAVNVSARNLGRDGFAGHVVQAIAQAGVEPRRLSVEVTETALMTDPVGAADALRELSAAGVHVSIDDFGCGQTSLGYLSSLPIDELKIDRSFIADMTDDPAHAAIVRSIVELGHNLGFEVVGEGIETDQVKASLTATGCDIAQGYLFARPMALDQLIPWLEEHAAPMSATSPRG